MVPARKTGTVGFDKNIFYQEHMGLATQDPLFQSQPVYA